MSVTATVKFRRRAPVKYRYCTAQQLNRFHLIKIVFVGVLGKSE
jgi:hypothetical protein